MLQNNTQNIYKIKNNNDIIINCIGKNTNEKGNTRLINLIKKLKLKKKIMDTT